MVSLDKTIDQLIMATHVHCYDHVVKRECDHVLRTFDLEVEGERKKGTLKRLWQKQVKEASMKVGVSMEDAFC